TLEEISDSRRTARARQIVEEKRAVYVDHLATRESGSPRRQLLQRRNAVGERGSSGDHGVLGAFETSDACEPRFVVYGQPLGHPAGLVRVSKQQRIPTENALAKSPDSARAVKMKDVRQLVGDDQRVPILVVAQ